MDHVKVKTALIFTLPKRLMTNTACCYSIPSFESLPMSALYLWFNALTYAVFALWCTLQPTSTSQTLGYLSLSPSGQSEYATVYGGMQCGLALLFTLFAMKPELRRTGVLAAILLYAPIVLYRLISLTQNAPLETLTYAVAALEVTMLIAAVAIWFASTRHKRS